jgi:uncharacterized membrane protein YphA (DoxX/SURF4 family)
MSLAAKLRRAPLRVATGAFILNAGIGKLSGDETTAKAMHGMASGAYPVLAKVPPKPFLKAVAIGEVTLGSALLLPVVPAGLAGLALTGFSGAMLGMWWRTPGMHEDNSPRPTQSGTPIAKDIWMLGAGTALVIDAALSESPVTNEHSRAETKATLKAEAKAARKATKRATKRAAKQARRQAASLLPG